VHNCTTEASGTKCSEFYHDMEQTPTVDTSRPSRAQVGDWFIYNNTNDVSGLHPGWHTITDGGPQSTWESCRDAADAAARNIFCFWKYHPTDANGSCWFSSEWSTAPLPNHTTVLPVAEPGHVSGYKPNQSNSSDQPPPPLQGSGLCADGECHCGEGLPCGEYLWCVSIQYRFAIAICRRRIMHACAYPPCSRHAPTRYAHAPSMRTRKHIPTRTRAARNTL
jgi:hypothetical protein